MNFSQVHGIDLAKSSFAIRLGYSDFKTIGKESQTCPGEPPFGTTVSC